jgi:hypothetical protein
MRWIVVLLTALSCATHGGESSSSIEGFCASRENAEQYWKAFYPLADPDYPYIEECVERNLLSERSHSSICEFFKSKVNQNHPGETKVFELTLKIRRQSARIECMESRSEILTSFIEDLELGPACQDRAQTTELVWNHIRILRSRGLASSSQAACRREDVERGVDRFCNAGDGEVFHDNPACPSPAA